MVDFKSIVKKRWWLFLLFLLPSTIVVNFTNDFLYPLTMNSESSYKFTSYFSLVIMAIIFVIIYSFIESKISRDSLKKTFKILVILISVIFIFLTLMNILVSGLFRYESCGETFNNVYIQAAKEKDSSFCFDTDIDLNYYVGFKGYTYCTTPNKDSIEIFKYRNDVPEYEKPKLERLSFEGQSTSCISSFADYTQDVNVCQSLKIHNDNLTDEDKVYFFDSKVSGCIYNFATRNKDWQVCDLILETNYPSKQSEWEQCIKVVSWRTKDKSLCEKIPSSSSLKNACLKG
jgi:hypothetical protein